MRKIVLGVTTIAATACHEARGPFQKIANKPEITEVANFLNHENKIALKDTTYKFFGRDTVRLRGNNLENYIDETRRDLNHFADKKIPKVVTGSHKVHNYCGGGVFKDAEVLDRTNKFIDPKVIIKNELFKNKDGDIFVPVEFYGKKNPDPILKKFEN